MRKRYFIFTLAILLLAFSCKDDIPSDLTEESPVVDPSSPDSIVLWKRALLPDTSSATSMNCYFHDGKIITSAANYTSPIIASVLCYAETGEKIWEWNDYVSMSENNSINYSILDKDQLLLSSRQDNYGIDVNSGNTIWDVNFHSGGYSVISTSNINLAFKGVPFGIVNSADSTKLYAIDKTTGASREIYTLKANQFWKKIPSATAYIDQAGDSIVVFQSRQYHLNPYVKRADLYCYNMTKKELVWQIDDIIGNRISNQRAPLQDAEHIYFAGLGSVLCIEKKTGTILWETWFPSDFLGSNYIIHQDKFITSLGNGDLGAIDINTGELLWLHKALTGCCAELSAYDGKVYIGNEYLHIVDVETGEELFQYETSTPGGFFSRRVAVDLEKQRIYLTDNRYLLCLKHPNL